MNLSLRMKSVAATVWAFVTLGDAVYMRDSGGAVFVKIARSKYDPFTDRSTMIVKHQGVRELNPDGSVDNSTMSKWMYINRSKRVLQTLKR